jgi:S1-C subfamily serine protease
MRIIAVLAVNAALTGQAIAQDRSQAVGKVLPALALVIAPQTNNKDMASTGTAFCFWSTTSKSYFVTNKHVIEGGSEILLQPYALSTTVNHGTLFKARVFPSSLLYADADLAVLVIDVGNIPQVVFEEDEPSIGQSIGIAGYPSFRFEPPNSPSDITPSAHFGTINSVAFADMNYVEFDAVADHGNSGGPLFDAHTGFVKGVVTLGIQSKTSKAVQNNLALKIVASYVGTVFLPSNNHSSTGTQTEFPCRKYDLGTMRIETTIPALNLQNRQKFCSLPDASP